MVRIHRPQNGFLEISSCGTGVDNVLYIHTTACGSEDCYAGGDADGCYVDNEESAGIMVTGGNTYLIEWTDELDSDGFDWTLTFTPHTGPAGGQTCQALGDIECPLTPSNAM
jgi:hypothetical protein